MRRIDAAVRAATGHEAFPEAVWTSLRSAPESVHLAVAPDGRAAAIAMVADSFRRPVRQFAIGALPGTEQSEVRALIDTLGDSDPADELWLPGSESVVAAAATAAGFTVDRRLYQMRVALPVSAATLPPGITLRGFRRGKDEAAWLDVNNRAFANHPDQGAWIRDRLEARMDEPWFDPAGFLLAEANGALVGFCWTKVHTEPEHLGEIFVIGVDPAAHGQRLGRALVLAGLDHLHRNRGCATGILYVAAENAVAVGLYESIGFAVVRTDTAMRRGAR